MTIGPLLICMSRLPEALLKPRNFRGIATSRFGEPTTCGEICRNVSRKAIPILELFGGDDEGLADRRTDTTEINWLELILSREALSA